MRDATARASATPQTLILKKNFDWAPALYISPRRERFAQKLRPRKANLPIRGASGAESASFMRARIFHSKQKQNSRLEEYAVGIPPPADLGRAKILHQNSGHNVPPDSGRFPWTTNRQQVIRPRPSAPLKGSRQDGHRTNSLVSTGSVGKLPEQATQQKVYDGCGCEYPASYRHPCNASFLSPALGTDPRIDSPARTRDHAANPSGPFAGRRLNGSGT